MLRNLPEHIRACLHEAAECRERAARYDSEEFKQPYLDMERRWMRLAQSYEFMEALDRFLADKDRAKEEEEREKKE